MSAISQHAQEKKGCHSARTCKKNEKKL